LLRADNLTYVHGGAVTITPGVISRNHSGSDCRVLPGVQDVSLSVEGGSVVGLLGPNGSGKTTLLRLLAGMLTPASGTVSLDGVPIAAMDAAARARRIAVVPQETHLAFDYTVLEIALMGRYPHLGAFELEGPRDVQIAREALAATGTASLERRLFATLSGGEKQRVVIASALAQQADVLLLDEPTASLDVGYQFEVANLLGRLNKERGLTIVVATHDLNFAAGLCHSLVLVSEGRVVNAGPTDDTLTSLNIQTLYGVVADVYPHHAAGHLTVVPLRKVNRD
jgi:iron complex transport system ATP-binding protein